MNKVKPDYFLLLMGFSVKAIKVIFGGVGNSKRVNNPDKNPPENALRKNIFIFCF
jgi:hypothetical protein